MKISNDYVKVQNKEQAITLKNLILDKYLELFVRTQKNIDYEDRYSDDLNKSFTNCFIKFDDKLENITGSSDIDKNSFDLSIVRKSYDITNSDREVNVSYKFDTKGNHNVYDIKKEKYITDLADYIGRKITAIGFGNHKREIFAILDTNAYSLSIQDSNEFNIFRKDIFSSDAICDSIPYHLSPVGQGEIYYDDGYYQAKSYAKLYSVGLGTQIGKMNNEKIIGKDIDMIEIDNTSFGFNLRKGSNKIEYPNSNMFCSSSKYPLPLYVFKELSLTSSLYLGSGKYPLLGDYKYVIYKYRMYYINRGGQMVELDQYYTMSCPINTKGYFQIITKIERNDN